MHSEYTDQDTERARQIEQSSAGQPTQSLAPAGGAIPTAGAPAAPAAQGRNNPLGIALIGFGVLLLLGRFFPQQLEIEGGMALLTIASVFLFFAFWKRIYGLLIPGSILAGLSLGVTFASLTDGVSVMWGLALGFLGIQFIGRALFNQQSNWPVYPAVSLFAVGVMIAVANLPGFLAAGAIWMPLLLIGLGLYLGWGRQRIA